MSRRTKLVIAWTPEQIVRINEFLNTKPLPRAPWPADVTPTVCGAHVRLTERGPWRLQGVPAAVDPNGKRPVRRCWMRDVTVVVDRKPHQLVQLSYDGDEEKGFEPSICIDYEEH